MNLLIAALAGALFGTGVVLVVRGALVHPAPLHQLRADLHRPRSAASHGPTGPANRIWSAAATAGLAGRESDLAICERSAARFVADRITWAAIGIAGAGSLLLLRPIGVFGFVPFPMMLAAVPAAAVAGWFYALIDLRSDAVAARRGFVHSLAAYLELTSILMAGGAGVETALHEAAAIGTSPGFRHIRAALSAASVRREPPWSAFGELGRRIGVRELEQLEASMTLAGSGARVKDSLRVRAEGLRERDLAEQEAAAHARSETMVLPVAMMFAGFVLLLGYPAIAGLS